MASDPSAGIPAERLVLTWSRRMWHVSQPTTSFYTLCQSRVSTARRHEDPVWSDVCKRCRRAYEKESTDA